MNNVDSGVVIGYSGRDGGSEGCPRQGLSDWLNGGGAIDANNGITISENNITVAAAAETSFRLTVSVSQHCAVQHWHDVNDLELCFRQIDFGEGLFDSS